MEKDNKERNTETLQTKIWELEHTYAELLADGANHSTLNEIWKEIQMLQAELNARDS